MNIDARKQEMLVTLEQVREECELLIERLHGFREDLLEIKTEEEAKEFDRTHNLEEGLRYISLY